MRLKVVLPFLLAVFQLGLTSDTHADEGLWLFDGIPLQDISQTHSIKLTPQWLEHVQLASVRFGRASSSFVSSEGLVLTNLHVGQYCIHKLSRSGKDYLRHGYLANVAAEELRCPDTELNVLTSIEDVTSRIAASISPIAAPVAQELAKRRAIANSVRDCNSAPDQSCEVVTLFNGARFHLYRYKRYTDVRLVFAPDSAIAYFGGWPDNFAYPRHMLDVALFRAYENGVPAKVKHFLKWSMDGVRNNETVFVSGHPRSTSRSTSAAQLEHLRDVLYPLEIDSLHHRRKVLEAFASASPESARRARTALAGTKNLLQAREGELAALSVPALIARKKEQEAALQRRSTTTFDSDDPWREIANALEIGKAHAKEFHFVGFGGAQLLELAGTIIQLSTELTKADEDRLEEYSESARANLELRLVADTPIYKDLEAALLKKRWDKAVDALGAEQPFSKVLQDVSAEQLINETKLDDVAERRRLLLGGRTAIENSADPLIVLARRLDPLVRQTRQFEEEKVKMHIRAAERKIAVAAMGLLNPTQSPDATGTLRFSFGVTKGYDSNHGRLSWATTLGELFARSEQGNNKGVVWLTARWRDAKPELDLSTPLNFVATADMSLGNSGSPVLNRNGELVGVVFDHNAHGFANQFAYSDTAARAIAVHSKAILEALEKVYQAHSLAQELRTGTIPVRTHASRQN